ncbi:hypothetical protein ACQPYE_19965 [Actinosynnema sp. CA-299493]
MPQACTLPTAERPSRVAEFDGLFATAVTRVERRDRTTLLLELERTAETAARVAELMVRENGCCSFFAFTLTAAGGGLELSVAVPAAHVEVLDALAVRVSAAGGPAA